MASEAKPSVEKPGKTGAPPAAQAKPVRPRLKVRYEQDVVPAIMQRYGLKCRLAVPRLEKICVNVGMGRSATENAPKLLEQCVQSLGLITGQKPVLTLARKSISNFKLRRGMKIGARVTLRGARMYEFFDRLVNVAIPRIRDFRGLSPRSFDGRGNYSLGLSEQSVFPEVETDKVESVHGMDVTICTTARQDKQALDLLKLMGMPFRER
jgi:large subunit ribosomal protein L5